MYEIENWRLETNRLMKQLCTAIGQERYRLVRAESYKTLKARTGVDIERKVRALKEWMQKDGASKTRIGKVNKLDVIEADMKLREIYTDIVNKLIIKHCA